MRPGLVQATRAAVTLGGPPSTDNSDLGWAGLSWAGQSLEPAQDVGESHSLIKMPTFITCIFSYPPVIFLSFFYVKKLLKNLGQGYTAHRVSTSPPSDSE